jgi:hypothetical protein
MACHCCVSIVPFDQIAGYAVGILSKVDQMSVDQITLHVIAFLTKHCAGQMSVDMASHSCIK